MAQANRPLSPHLQIYRWYLTMAMSIIQHYAPHTPVVPIHIGRHPAGLETGTKEPFVLTGRVPDEGSAEAMADAYFRLYGRLASTPRVSPSRKLACAS